MSEDDNRITLPATGTGRRQLLAALGVSGLGGVAGCGGGDGGDGGGAATTTAGSTPTSSTAGSTSTEGSSTTGTGTGDGDPDTTETSPPTDEVLDATFEVHVAPPGPGAAQYNPMNGNVVWKPGGAMVRFDFIRKSYVNNEWQPELLKDWNYRAGILDVEMFEDHYWAASTLDDPSPTNVTADDWMAIYDLKNFFRYPDAWPFIQDTEKQGEYSFRLYYDDTYRMDYAIRKTLDREAADNAVFFEPWLERFRDASTGEEITDIQVELQQKKIYDPNPFINVPFKVTGTTETRWFCELRDDEETTPRWVDQINYRNLDFVVSGEPARARQAFVNGELGFAGSGRGAAGGIGVVDADVTFDTTSVEIPFRDGPGAYGFNLNKAPTSNVHFRRAFAYMLNREKHSTRYMKTDMLQTGLFTEAHEQEYLTQEVRDACVDYGPGQVMTEAATAEMKAGGFERDSDGNWVYREGDRAGKPMGFKIPTYQSMARHANNATSFKNEMADWGIAIEVTMRPLAELWDDIGDGEYEIALAYWGGANPTQAFTNAYYPTADGAFAIRGFPGTWEGPPVGQPATPPDKAPDETESFEVANMLQALQLTRDDTKYRELVGRLAWTYNQALPMIPYGYEPGIYVFNTDDWNWPFPVEEHPFAWAGSPENRIWNRGVISAKPQ